MEGEVPILKSSLLVGILFSCLFNLGCTKELDVIYTNNTAIRYYKQGKKVDSFDTFAESLAKDPFNPTLQYNMSSGFIAMSEGDKAIKNYEEVVKSETLKKEAPQVYLGASYNLGVLLGAAGQIEKALEYYQKALEIDPEHKESKINIELLTKNQKGKGKGKGGKGKPDKKKGEGEKPENDENNEENQDKERTNKPQQPQKFDQKQMSIEGVRKIMEELKNQEKKIRAKNMRKGKKKQAPKNGKNW